MQKPKIQKMFEKSVLGLLTQRKKSAALNEYGTKTCLYRGPANTRCGIGFLIPDSKYKTSFEGKSVWAVPILNCLGVEINSAEADILGDIQDVHDKYPVKKWAKELRRVARVRNLDTTFMKGMR